MIRTLNPPEVKFLSFFDDCICNYRNGPIRERLTAARETLREESEQFVSVASECNYFQLPRTQAIGNATAADLIGLYDRLSDANHPAYAHYQKLFMQLKSKKCPLCGVGVAKTLDHFLPKSVYPALSIAPSNLVPACRDCNSAKLTSVSERQDDTTINPYFDRFFVNDRWLFARVVEKTPTSFQYYVEPPETWSAVNINRIKEHFRIHALAVTYGSSASEAISSMRFNLTSNLESGGAETIASILTEEAAVTAKVNQNHWKVAMLEAAAGNIWFCDGGFKNFVS